MHRSANKLQSVATSSSPGITLVSQGVF